MNAAESQAWLFLLPSEPGIFMSNVFQAVAQSSTDPRPIRNELVLLFVLLVGSTGITALGEDALAKKTIHKIDWQKNDLTISGSFPGDEIKINYLEAYCRPGSTDRNWGQTVIGHTTERKAPLDDPQEIHLRDQLKDGVVVEHVIRAGDDDVTFSLVAHNPTDRESQAHWAQPCMRVDRFTGCDPKNALALVPDYAKKCFLFIGGKPVRLPTQPWAEKARYTPGQVYCPKHVDRNDVNPRPLSELVPSSSLCGCYSSDEKMILAVAWEPYQEIFQGVITCIHNDFRLGGLKPGETKKIQGKLYIVPADMDKLVKRFEADFK
jgi:hypothetical protein